MQGKGYIWGQELREITNQSLSNFPIFTQLGGIGLNHELTERQAGFLRDWRKHPRISFTRDLIRNKIAAILSSNSYEQAQQASDLVSILENNLFMDAASEEEYVNQVTLIQRLQTIILNKMCDTKCSQQEDSCLTSSHVTMPSLGSGHGCYNRDLPEPCFQSTDDGSIRSTKCPTVTLNNTGQSSLSKGFLSKGHTWTDANMSAPHDLKFLSSPPSMKKVASETVLSPEDTSTITTYSDGDGFSNFGVSDGAGNLGTSSESSFSCHFQKRHLDDGELDLINYTGSMETNKKTKYMVFPSTLGEHSQPSCPNLLNPQRVTWKLPEVSRVCPIMSQSLSLQDSLQSQFHKLDAQQNLKQSKWSCEQFQKQFFAQSNMGSVDQNEVSCQMSTRNPFEQPQLPSRLSNGNQHFTSQNSTFIYDSNGTAHANSCSRPETSPEHKILLAYVNYKSLAALGGETPVSFVEYLHSTAFDDGMRSCEQYSTLLPHFNNCQGDNCHICWPLKHFFVTDELLPNLEPTNDMGIGFTQRDYDGADCAHFEGMLRPAKRLKMETPNVSPFTDKISHCVAPKMLHSCSPDGLLDFQQQLESPISINSNEMDNSMQPFRNPTVDSTIVTETHNSVIHNTSNLTFESETILSEGLKAGFESEKVHPKSTSISEIRHNLIDNTSRLAIVSETILSEGLETGLKSEEVHLKCSDEISGNVKENANRLVSIMHNFPKNASANGREDVQDKTEFNQTGPGLMCDVVTSKADNGKSTKYMYLEMNGVSLTEIFTADQIREHIRSLRQLIVKGTLEDEQRIGVNSCKLCALDKLLFAPVPLYCTFCGARIKRSAIYYCKGEEFDTQHCFCTSCYKGSRGGCISFNGISIDKTMLDSKRNDGETEEPWVQCDKCEGWQHQICALFNDKRDLEGKAEYICPICCLEEIKNGERVPLPKSAVFSAKELPRTMLSDHIENRLFSHLKQEREDRAKVKGKNVDEVSGADDLVVRVVLSVNKQLKVKKQFLDIFCGENYPAEFPYRSKVILLFQKIEGVDVCLFGMYVQEFGSECCQPNQRCVYISYLDSVKYFRPETETVTGEALRTFVYHEILIGYLDFCKKRGFSTCYIWACPPLKGEDYILYCHPQAQKTPKSDKLRKWYQIMLRKAAKENIVVSFTNIYDHFFVPTGEYNSKITAARLPYFDGDYWSGAAIDVIRNIEKESGGDYQRKVKKVMTKRTLKAMGHTNPSDGATKDILLMQKLGQSILPMKEDFIVVQLQFVCVHCSEVISSGNRWFCSQCEKYQICERCHNSEQNLVGKEIHTSVSGEQHILSQVTVNIPSDTKEKDATLDNGLFENRHTLLSFCQQNHFQFDTLRRAKHSSMMIVHHLRNSTVMTVGTTCCICLEDNVVHCWLCDICMDFVVCVACYKEKGANCHVHSLTQRSLEAKGLKGNKESLRKALLTRELLEVLQHAFQCRTNKNQPCSYPNCIQIKKLFIHANRCSIRASGGCEPCKKAWLGLNVHSRNCRESDCRIPRCMDLKRHAEWLQLQSETRRRAAFVEFARQKRT